MKYYGINQSWWLGISTLDAIPKSLGWHLENLYIDKFSFVGYKRLHCLDPHIYYLYVSLNNILGGHWMVISNCNNDVLITR